jgi:hypothetical protein
MFVYTFCFVKAGKPMSTNKKEVRKSKIKPETRTKRQATQHDCMLSLLGDGDK